MYIESVPGLNRFGKNQTINTFPHKVYAIKVFLFYTNIYKIDLFN